MGNRGVIDGLGRGYKGVTGGRGLGGEGSSERWRGGRAEGRITGLILDLKSPISTTSGGKVEG